MQFKSSLALLVLTASLVGCAGESGEFLEELVAQRTRLVLSTEPPGAIGILDVCEQLDSLNKKELVIVGKIGGVAEPWTPGQATFVIADPFLLAGDEHNPQCDCPFCESNRKLDPVAGLALVEFNSDDGKVLSIDAQRLFELKTHQIVVVRGRARTNELGNLIVAANGLYVRR